MPARLPARLALLLYRGTAIVIDLVIPLGVMGCTITMAAQRDWVAWAAVVAGVVCSVGLSVIVVNRVIVLGATGYTLGKMVTGTRTRSASGQGIGATRAALRLPCAIVDIVIIGWFSVLVDEDARSLADRLCRTTTRRDEVVPAEHRRSAQRSVLVASAALLVAIAGLGWSTITMNVTTRSIDEQRGPVVKAASVELAAMFTYSPATVSDDLERAAGGLTGDLKSSFTQYANGVVAPAAVQNGTTMAAKVDAAGVESISSDRAVVLVYLTRAVSKSGEATPTQFQGVQRVELERVSNRWLISKLVTVQ